MVSNEGDLFELVHKWGKLLLRFGTQDLERHFSAQVPSNARQTVRLRFIGLIGLVWFRETIKESSSPLGALLTFPLHACMITPFPLPFIDNTAHMLQGKIIFIFKKYPSRTDGTSRYCTVHNCA